MHLTLFIVGFIDVTFVGLRLVMNVLLTGLNINSHNTWVCTTQAKILLGRE